MPEELAAHGTPPEELLYLLRWFNEVRLAGVICYQQLNSWAQLRSIKLQSWEVAALFKMQSITDNV